MSNKEISVSYDGLQEVITEMKNKRSDWTGISVAEPSFSGGGITPNIVNETVHEFQVVYNSLCTLMDNTIIYLENVYNKFQQSETAVQSDKEK